MKKRAAPRPINRRYNKCVHFHIRRRSYLKLYRAFREEGGKGERESKNKGNEGRGRDVRERKMETEPCKIAIA